jgi:hypothetical protein
MAKAAACHRYTEPTIGKRKALALRYLKARFPLPDADQK